MAQDYDKIFKENFEKLIATIAQRVIKIDSKNLEEIPDSSQYTIEKQPDFLKKIKRNGSKGDSILHIEVQTTDPSTMICRMLIYYGFLYNDHRIPIEQFVIYIGDKDKPNIPFELEHDKLSFSFTLINMQKLNHEDFLYSSQPEDVIMAILCNFNKKPAEAIVMEIIRRIKRLTANELDLKKFLVQLEVLSKLRNLQEVVIQKKNKMAVTYDLKTDIRYMQGEKTGVTKGIELGERNTKLSQIKKVLEKNPYSSNQQIADRLFLDLAEVELLRKEI